MAKKFNVILVKIYSLLYNNIIKKVNYYKIKGDIYERNKKRCIFRKINK